MLLGIALLPLGVVAILASFDQASDARESRYAEVNLLAEVGSRHLSSAIADAEMGLRSAVVAMAAQEDLEANCQSAIDRAVALEPRKPPLAILDGDGRLICASEGFEPVSTIDLPAPGQATMAADIDREAIILAQASPDGRVIGLAELTRESLALLPQPTLLARNYQITLSRDDDLVVVRPWSDPVADDRVLNAAKPISDTGFILSASFEKRPLSTAELFAIALPVLMWAVAALLGWIAIAQLLIRPLTRLRHAVVRHANGDANFELPHFPISAIEIQQLAQAFEDAFDTLHSHEEQLAAGLEEQVRLTREVHHRVKNNLQIIASLLNLHARAAKSDDSAAAYASIQRRVDALAIVQRNLFAELDNDSGLPLRPVVAELASGLQQSAPPSVEIAITLDVDSVRVGQDIAAPTAFLITELVELAMLCGEWVEIAITVTALADRCARLAVRSAALAEASNRDEFPRYRRVLTGMARQLQASLDEEESGTLFTIAIPTL
ncbi:sensor histidine kinase [Parasphingopyxis algicola]|uniref:sensor histidine kinase n=1 Tax=Parasphingopyxis algicola TaxID=2026624 RepID=UPI001C40AC77|nr:histidine kinase dimerization/phosphoacceptor domain -containing protein [Parasphingopyxis algicola]